MIQYCWGGEPVKEGCSGEGAEKVSSSQIRKASICCGKESGFDLKTVGATERTLAEEGEAQSDLLLEGSPQLPQSEAHTWLAWRREETGQPLEDKTSPLFGACNQQEGRASISSLEPVFNTNGGPSHPLG